MNRWIKDVIKCYQNLGEDNTKRWLYETEQKIGKMSFVDFFKCDLFEPNKDYCYGCNFICCKDKKQYFSQEIKEWIPITIRPHESTESIIVYNSLGDKYIAHFNQKNNCFINECGMIDDDIVAYNYIDKKHLYIFKKICKMVSCSKCIYLKEKNGIYQCKRDNGCETYRYNEFMPSYRRIYYTEQEEK